MVQFLPSYVSLSLSYILKHLFIHLDCFSMVSYTFFLNIRVLFKYAKGCDYLVVLLSNFLFTFYTFGTSSRD